MKTLAVCYSKTGNTKKVADAVVEKLNCDLDELEYDIKTKTMRSFLNPADYDRVIILCPIWAFGLADPMKQYLSNYRSDIKEYSLIVTYSLFGLKGCVSNCVSILGKPPGIALKIKGKAAKQGDCSIDAVN